MKTLTTTNQPAGAYEFFLGCWIAIDASTNEKKALIALQDAGYLNPGESVALGKLAIARQGTASWALTFDASHRAANSSMELLAELRHFFGSDAQPGRVA